MIYLPFRCCLGPLYILSKAMGYICGYFRAPGARRSRQLVLPEPVSVDDHEHVIHQNHLAYLFSAEGNVNIPAEVEAMPSISPAIDYKEPRDQAFFLKACGVLSEIPESPHMPSLDVSDHNSEDPFSPNSHPWSLDTEISKELSGLFENTSNRCNSHGSDSGDECGSSEITPIRDIRKQDRVSPVLTERNLNTGFPPSTVRNKNKSVHFEFEKEEYFSTHPSENIENTERIESPEHRYSPYPTPLKIEDGMQTPGTVFPANAMNLRNRNIFIKSHYVYPDLNLVENISRSEAHTRENSDDAEKVSREIGYCDPTIEVIPGCSLVRSHGSGTVCDIVTAQRADQLSCESIKWREENGIPNSTRKYMEDQKVCYHATPFEERLEKAILEDGFKASVVMPLIFEE